MPLRRKRAKSESPATQADTAWQEAVAPRPPDSGQVQALDQVLSFVRSARGFDSTAYCPSVLETRIRGRLLAAGVASLTDYLQLLATSPAELDLLMEVMTVKVSSFFRDPIAFEYLNEHILPVILAEKAAAGDRSLRIWSAGCANGEEPYSLAILIHELTHRDDDDIQATIFATDIDQKALTRARAALYPVQSLAGVRHGLVESAFLPEGQHVRIRPPIAKLVRFSVYDMLDQRTSSPAESVFGSFDLVLCRNLLIYFQHDYQDVICRKLYRSLADGGFLLLGRTETLTESWRGRFRRVTDCCQLYRRPTRSDRSPAGNSAEPATSANQNIGGRQP